MFRRTKDGQTKIKGPSSRDILRAKIMQEVEALNQGQAVIYELPEFYTFARFLGVELNPEFPQKGKKYLTFSQQMVDGKPNEKRYTGGINKASDYADWVSERDVEAYGHIKRVQ